MVMILGSRKMFGGKNTFEFRPENCTEGLEADARAKCLIDPATGRWKEETVRECFDNGDAGKVLGIPLFPSLPPDRLTWSESPSGFFTVKSAYHLNRAEQSNEELSLSGRSYGEQPLSRTANYLFGGFA